MNLDCHKVSEIAYQQDRSDEKSGGPEEPLQINNKSSNVTRDPRSGEAIKQASGGSHQMTCQLLLISKFLVPLTLQRIQHTLRGGRHGVGGCDGIYQTDTRTTADGRGAVRLSWLASPSDHRSRILKHLV